MCREAKRGDWLDSVEPFRLSRKRPTSEFILFEPGIVVALQAHTWRVDWIGMIYSRAAVLISKHL